MSTLTIRRDRSSHADSWDVVVDGLRVDALYSRGQTVVIDRPGGFVCFVRTERYVDGSLTTNEIRLTVRQGQDRHVALRLKGGMVGTGTFEEVPWDEEEAERIEAAKKDAAAHRRETGQSAASAAVGCVVFGFLLPVFAIVLGPVAIAQGKKAKSKGWRGPGATAGIVLGAIQAVAWVAVVAYGIVTSI
jgi:hypothetical protein